MPADEGSQGYDVVVGTHSVDDVTRTVPKVGPGGVSEGDRIYTVYVYIYTLFFTHLYINY